MAWYESKISKRSSKENLFFSNKRARHFEIFCTYGHFTENDHRWTSCVGFLIYFYPARHYFSSPPQIFSKLSFRKKSNILRFQLYPTYFYSREKNFLEKNFLFRIYESSSSGRYKYARFSSKILPISRNNNINLYRFIRFDQIVGSN